MRCSACGAEVGALNSCPGCGGLARSASEELTVMPGETLDRAATAIGSGPAVADGSGHLAPGQQFGPRYRIVELLGAGGMGGVYRASDDVLGIDVALKVIRPEYLRDPEAAARFERRFKRELLLARRVSHPNVVRIHDIGEVGGVLYLTMSLVEGTDLGSLLEREGTLSVERTLGILRQLVGGLSAAHAAGVIHRDLKPANVMVDTADTPLLMDFGVARLSGADEDGPDTGGSPGAVASAIEVTSAANVVGTLSYMAPEQSRGRTDERSDIYALGLIVRDLLLGRPRVEESGGPAAELEARMAAAPPPPHEVDPAVPEPLSNLVARCLAPAPVDRYQTVPELAAELDRLDSRGAFRPARDRRLWWGGAAAAGVLAALGGGWWATSPVELDPVSILVADFDNDTGEAVFDGTVEQALTISLEDAPFITAYPRAGARGLAAGLDLGETLDADAARLIAAREGITLVLTGEIASAASGYRLSVTAAEPAGEADASAVRAEANAVASSGDDVLAAVRQMATELRAAFGEAIDAGEIEELPEVYTTVSLEAMSAYTRAQRALDSGREAEALASYEEAVAHDPTFGRAHAGIGAIYANQRDQGPAEAAYQLALQHLDRMSERERYRTLAGYHLSITRDYRAAADALRTLVDLYPVDNGGRSNLALVSLYLRDVDEAVRHGRAAVDLYRTVPLQQANLASYLMYAGRFGEAIEESGLVLERLDESGGGGYVEALARHTTALSLVARGDYRGAEGELSVLAATDAYARSMADLARADMRLYRGRSREAADGLADALTTREGALAAVHYVTLGEALWAAGEPERAVEAVREAVALGAVESVRYAAARVMIGAGLSAEALRIADQLASEALPQTVAFARLLEGEAALEDGSPAEALERFRTGQAELDVWLAPVLVGHALFQMGEVAAARVEWERALDRRGEAVDVFIEDRATLRYLPPVYYWLGRAHEALAEAEEARARYLEYLQLREAAEPPDPLAEDAARRLQDL